MLLVCMKQTGVKDNQNGPEWCPNTFNYWRQFKLILWAGPHITRSPSSSLSVDVLLHLKLFVLPSTTNPRRILLTLLICSPLSLRPSGEELHSLFSSLSCCTWNLTKPLTNMPRMQQSGRTTLLTHSHCLRTSCCVLALFLLMRHHWHVITCHKTRLQSGLRCFTLVEKQQHSNRSWANWQPSISLLVLFFTKYINRHSQHRKANFFLFSPFFIEFLN